MADLSGGRIEPPADLVEIGRVLGAHGIKGWIKIAPHGSTHDSVLVKSRLWWLHGLTPGKAVIPPGVLKRPASGAQAAGATPDDSAVAIDIVQAKAQHDTIVAQIRGVDDRDVAQAFKGARISVGRSEFPAPADPDEVYWVDMIGCQVSDPTGVLLGTVHSVEEFGAHPLLNVRGPDGLDRLIPFVSQTIVSVDVVTRRIVAMWALDY